MKKEIVGLLTALAVLGLAGCGANDGSVEKQSAATIGSFVFGDYVGSVDPVRMPGWACGSA